MKRWVKAAAAVTGAAAGAVVLGSRCWREESERAAARLFDRESAIPEPTFSPSDLDGLPLPVARYFSFALERAQPMIQRATAVQTGEFRVGGFEAPWKRLAATQCFASDPPGFLWDAHIRMSSLLTVQVRDSYLNGAGETRVRASYLIPVVDARGGAEMASGALHRFLAETVWLPTALLPRPGLTWTPINERSARATLTDSGTTVSLDFEFGDDGAIVSAYTPGRYREVKGSFIPTPWICQYGNYSRLNGVMIPRDGSVGWVLPEGHCSYCRIHIQAIEYECGPSRGLASEMRPNGGPRQEARA